ncbi:c-x8-c-x5-c-x3-h type zinc finger [Pyrenophora seminiperda CCB06]|uniref:C-x8-c-x5-c-x3-h type zinc finger n=1 Tax=Pyrenophora seminiperda CCB06 TaxID=1302712 RepID=A0A3M7MJF9_9PLEO|nr:c-x8-c-x5-c-x3-h type zinc finger [Pyrenophora seminiperda CCB06]
MASNHVPSDQVPIQGQNVYDAPYQHLFSSVDRYGTPSWEAQLHQHSGLPPNASAGQAWHHGSFNQQQPFNAISQSYGGQTQGLRTASPYQFGAQFSQQTTLGSYGQPSNVDPSLGLDPSTIRQQQQSPYQMPMRTVTPQGHGSTVTPQALQHNVASLQQARATATPQQPPKNTADTFIQQRPVPTSFVKPVPIPEYEIPKGRKSGGLHVVDQAALAKATNSVPLNKFVTLGSEPFHLATNRTALPVYIARQSLKDLKKAGADSKKLRAKQLANKSQSRALKSTKRPTELRREVSESETTTDSSDYDSDSSDEEEEQMPVPASRPEDPDAAVRYDVTKATWYPSTSSPSSDQIKTSMREIWEVLNTIQKRWRTDTRAVTEAEELNKTGELPVLKSRVTSQRDLLKSALGAALESAHPDVLYQLGHIKPFLYLCYQFLANRFRSKDYDGPLSAVIYEVLSRCGTLTSEVLEETKLVKALTSMKKHANEKHKAFIQKVMDGAVANSKKAKVSPPPRAEPTENKGVKRPATEAAGRSAIDNSSAKKPKTPETSANVKKDPATGAGGKTVSASAITTSQKRPGERAATAPAPVKTRVNQVTNKPSGIFASLTAAAKKSVPPPASTTGAKGATTVKNTTSAIKEKKPAAASKPAFSFAQTMASLQKPKEQESAPVKSEKLLPMETEQEKTKRERKESRRHLRVSWRPDVTLVEIKYFDHEADDEEMDHKEDHLVRDAGDIGGEGHMFKQHKELDLDDDDEEMETEQRSWNPPSLVDFSVVPPEERNRNYMPFGGGYKEPSCPEKEANVQRENATLIVYYSNTDDIPTSPKEPSEQVQENASASAVVHFGSPPDSMLIKCPQAPMPAAVPDFSQLENIIKQLSATNAPPVPTPVVPVENVYTPPPPSTASPWDLQAILNSISNGQAAPQSAPPVSFPPPPQPQLPMQPPGMSLDIAALIANMQAASGGALPPPPPLPTGYPPFPFPMAPQSQQPDTAPWSQQIPDAATHQSQYNQQTNGGVKRQRDDSNGNNDRNPGKRAKIRDHKPPHKVLACKFYSKGQCNKGDNCTYIHDQNQH